MATTTPGQLEIDLATFMGGDEMTRHSANRKFFYTEGVKFLAQEAKAFWLVDEIAFANMFQKKVIAEEFQSWTLRLNETGMGALLFCTDGNTKTIFSVHIPMTDFPLKSINLFFENNVLCLPNER